MLDLIHLQLCLLFFLKTVKLYKNICSAWISRTSAEFFSHRLTSSTSQKYNRSIVVLRRTFLWIFGKWYKQYLFGCLFSIKAKRWQVRRFQVWGARFQVSGAQVPDARSQVSGSRCQGSAVWCQVPGVRCQVPCATLQVSGIRSQGSGLLSKCRKPWR